MAERTTLHLVRRPVGLARPEDFEIRRSPLPSCGEGELRVALRFISMDPAMRGWMNERRSYIPPIPLGGVVRAYGAGVVDVSSHPKFAVGDAVVGVLGAQSHAVVDGGSVYKVDTDAAPLERWIGGLGMPGLTAYFGLLEIGKPQPGGTLLVSAAAGAVGSVVGQLGKIHGCHVVGIAGGPEKCRYVKEALGFDACVDYRAEDFEASLDEACPEGVDIYFANVGGAVLDAALRRMRPFGRIPLCGMISAYNATRMPPGPKHLLNLLVQRVTLRGFIVSDFRERYPEALRSLGRWYQEGKIHLREDLRDGGLASFCDVLNCLYSGDKRGKLALRV